MIFDATIHAAIFYAVLGFVVAWATVILVGQFWVMWQNRYEAKAVRRIRSLKALSDEWPQRPHRRVS